MFHLEPLVWNLRAGINFKEFGDDFQFVATITKIGPNTCRVTAAMGEIPKDHEVRFYRLFLKHLKDNYGFTEVVFERAKDLKMKKSQS